MRRVRKLLMGYMRSDDEAKIYNVIRQTLTEEERDYIIGTIGPGTITTGESGLPFISSRYMGKLIDLILYKEEPEWFKLFTLEELCAILKELIKDSAPDRPLPTTYAQDKGRCFAFFNILCDEGYLQLDITDPIEYTLYTEIYESIGDMYVRGSISYMKRLKMLRKIPLVYKRTGILRRKDKNFRVAHFEVAGLTSLNYLLFIGINTHLRVVYGMME